MVICVSSCACVVVLREELSNVGPSSQIEVSFPFCFILNFPSIFQ